MTNIRRHHIPNATVFMTAVCSQREKYLEGEWSKELLTSVLAEVAATGGVSIIGHIILDDHFHWMVDLSADSSFLGTNLVDQVTTNGSNLKTLMRTDKTPTISEIMQSIKLRFTHRYKKAKNIPGNIIIWQRRFWDHIIRDQKIIMPI